MMGPQHIPCARMVAVSLLPVLGLMVGCGEDSSPRSPATKAPSQRPAALAAAPGPQGGLVPIPLGLPPKAHITKTPTNFPPGTRVPPRGKGPDAARPAFLAPRGVANIALSTPVTSSDMEPVIGSLSMITDGCKDARENTYVELGPNLQWVQIDLKGARKVYAVAVWHEHTDPRLYHDVVVQVADDEAFGTNVRTLYNNDHDNSAGRGVGAERYEYFETHEGLLVDGQGAKARYVRLYSSGSTGDDLNRYTEVEVYGLPAP